MINAMCDVIVLPYKHCPGTSMGRSGNANWEWQSANATLHIEAALIKKILATTV